MCGHLLNLGHLFVSKELNLKILTHISDIIVFDYKRKNIWNSFVLDICLLWFIELILISILHQGKQLHVLLLLFWIESRSEITWIFIIRFYEPQSKTKGKTAGVWILVNRETMLSCTTKGSSIVTGNRWRYFEAHNFFQSETHKWISY